MSLAWRVLKGISIILYSTKQLRLWSHVRTGPGLIPTWDIGFYQILDGWNRIPYKHFDADSNYYDMINAPWPWIDCKSLMVGRETSNQTKKCCYDVSLSEIKITLQIPWLWLKILKNVS